VADLAFLLLKARPLADTHTAGLWKSIGELGSIAEVNSKAES
jgi:hypothetical protein